MWSRTRMLLVSLGVCFALGIGAGTITVPASEASGDCMQNYKCKIEPDGDRCVSGGFGCEWLISTCKGC